jgi:GTPase SAR1 family protein
VLVGNKCDLEDRRVVSYEEGYNLAKRMQLNFLEVSAKQDLNI